MKKSYEELCNMVIQLQEEKLNRSNIEYSHTEYIGIDAVIDHIDHKINYYSNSEVDNECEYGLHEKYIQGLVAALIEIKTYINELQNKK